MGVLFSIFFREGVSVMGKFVGVLFLAALLSFVSSVGCLGQSQATRYAGETYPAGSNIQSAITDAGTTGTVIIPAAYGNLTETFTNTNNIPILDLRRATKAYGNVANVMDYGA